ncbi:spermidine/putrescine ABC transporter substrate-binding protein [Neiella sp. HB171785]|uniref:Spermidine/putrescine ABC transporter substrate-binding protein n=1 Tax=Neiella litorisoli TaxID=2771431 RepID=A0A8J6UMD4_9GAMM|nr:spermidine/putrescine ABC transporter substrate-binding protein [Neiella litorisoli]MBD1390600.1 spermidine/putrescine ABC transporter substrate-binding protein [Neiella litorisoli]
MTQIGLHVRRLFSTFILFVGCSALAQAAQVLNILTWEEYLSPEVKASFEQQTGIEVRLAYFDSDEMRDQILSSQAGRYIDIALMDSQQIGLYAKQSRLAALPPQQLPNLKHIDPAIHQACNAGPELFGVAYSWGTLGVVYRADLVKPEDIDTWSKFLDPPTYLRGHIAGHVDLFDSLIPALISLDYPINTNKVTHLREAFELTKLWLPNVRTLEYIITAAQSYPDFNQLFAALAYSGDQKILNDLSGHEHWQYLLPSDGSLLWTDCFAVIAQSENQAAASQFLNFIQQPENAALNAEYTHTATPNMAALPLTSEAYRQDPIVHLPEAQKKRLQPYAPVTIDAINLRSRILSALEKIHATQ